MTLLHVIRVSSIFPRDDELSSSSFLPLIGRPLAERLSVANLLDARVKFAIFRFAEDRSRIT